MTRENILPDLPDLQVIIHEKGQKRQTTVKEMAHEIRSLRIKNAIQNVFQERKICALQKALIIFPEKLEKLETTST